MIWTHQRAGLTAAQTLTTLWTMDSTSNLAITLKDVHNYWSQICQEDLDGRSSIQALLFQLEMDCLTFNERDNEQWIVHLAFFHKESLNLLQWHPEVLVVDSTYKTNWFGLPLFNIFGILSIGKTFYCGGCFMKEDEPSFTWILQKLELIYLGFSHLHSLSPTTIVTDADPAMIAALATVFPDIHHFLCIWHIQK